MADTQYTPWWLKAPILLQYGIVGVPSLIAIAAMALMWTLVNKQYDLISMGQQQTAKAQEQTQGALDLYKGQVSLNNLQTDTLKAIADKMTGSFQHVAQQHEKLLRMELFTCKTAARTPSANDQCSSYLRDLDEHLINDSFSLLNGVEIDGRRVTTNIGRSYQSSNEQSAKSGR